MPMWGRAVPDNHAVPAHGNTRAGYPDFILFHSPDFLAHAAVVEVKTAWAYTRQTVRGIFETPILTDDPTNINLLPGGIVGGGFFDWQSNRESAKLLRQVSIQTLSMHKYCTLIQDIDLGSTSFFRC